LLLLHTPLAHRHFSPLVAHHFSPAHPHHIPRRTHHSDALLTQPLELISTHHRPSPYSRVCSFWTGACARLVCVCCRPDTKPVLGQHISQHLAVLVDAHCCDTTHWTQVCLLSPSSSTGLPLSCCPSSKCKSSSPAPITTSRCSP
jgi:hypothetical protein